MRLSLAKAASKHNQKHIRLDARFAGSRLGVASAAQPAGIAEAAIVASASGNTTNHGHGNGTEHLIIPVPEPESSHFDEQVARDEPNHALASDSAITDSDAAAALLADLNPKRQEVAPAIKPIQPAAETRIRPLVPSASASQTARPPSALVDHSLAKRLFANKQLLGQNDGSRSKAGKGGGLLLNKATRNSAAAAIQAAPPEPDITSFAQVPVESFGDAVLRGMGASEEALTGREGVYEADAPRSMRGEFTGLGASRDPRVQAEMEERQRRRRRNAHAAAADDERAEAARARQRRFAGLTPGGAARIVAGPYRGRLALVQATEGVPGLDRMRVRLESLESRVARKVDAEAVTDEATLTAAERAAVEAMRVAEADASPPALPPQSATAAAAAAAKAEPAMPAKRARAAAASGDEEPGSTRGHRTRLPWLVPGIRVRVSDDALLGGRLFRRKAVVCAVALPRPGASPGGETCSIVVDGSAEHVHGVTARQLQTALPKPGQAVLCVAGPDAGRRGVLVSRSSARGEAEADLGAGRAARVVLLPFEAVAEWVGLPV